MIEGIIVLDLTQNGRPILRSSLPPSRLLHIDAYNAACPNPPPIIPLLPPAPPGAACHISSDSVALIAPISHNADPLLAFSLLDTLRSLLCLYLDAPSLSPLLIKDNFDLVFHLIEELIQNNVPNTTDPNLLRDIVLPPTFMNKIMSISPVAALTKPTSTPFSSPIPWRRAGVRHNNNEIFFDLFEELELLVTKSGSILDMQVTGEIRANSKLSGTPDLSLTFRNPEIVSNELFHQCVRIPKWTRDKSLSFVPPDGRFILMTYQHKPNASDILPFALKSALTYAGNSATLDLTLTSRSREPLENLSVEFVAGPGVSGASCNVSAGSNWGFEPKENVIQWDIPTVAPSSTHTLKSSFDSRDILRPQRALTIRFLVPNRPFSSLKVDQLKMTGELYKPYKGVRGSGGGLLNGGFEARSFTGINYPEIGFDSEDLFQ